MYSQTIHSTRELSVAQGALLRTLAYFDLFDHPLRLDELLRFRDGGPDETGSLLAALCDLEQRGLVVSEDGFWGLRNTFATTRERADDEARAKARLPKALSMSSRIAAFPFVRAVFISGSMSKGRLAPDGDIDFFVITAPGRLWIARTLLILYKKIFLLNSRRDFCVNYFLDTEHLAVEDRNRFTATELVTLIPTYGNGATETFFQRNQWAFEHYPGVPPPQSLELQLKRAGTKSTLERLLSGNVGNWMDEWCMALTWRYWKFKFSNMDPRVFDLALRTRTYVSKHHPRNFQKHVLDGFQQRIHDIEYKVGGPLP